MLSFSSLNFRRAAPYFLSRKFSEQRSKAYKKTTFCMGKFLHDTNKTATYNMHDKKYIQILHAV